ncbi:MAG: enoyl-CoA hydratase/isomerase family protein [Deltaproteobacteria bacterium]|nr:enoyl-CoA hydratase/isomerase family protein [Deltaproteobacteria bacterium]MBW2139366.1 enoyl-CoA hydratase/isomerase family protein [Deltaproteobacteria bacterium]
MTVDVLLEREGPVARVTINREAAYNALNRGVLERLEEIFEELDRDDQVRVVVVSGAGSKAFVSGADIKEIKDAGGKRPGRVEKGQKVFSRIRSSTKVVIAAVNGYALGGGCELALSCDIRIASENARFGFPEARLGLIPGYGGTQLLPRLIGTGRAKYMMLTGQIITAEEAFRYGMVEKVCPQDRLEEEVKDLTDKILSNGPLAVRAIKETVDRGLELSLEQGLKLEMESYGEVALSEDAEEGLSAFIEKRKPTYKGK